MPYRQFPKKIYHLYAGLFLSFTNKYPLGTNIFELDWDLLIILDACRADNLRQVASKYQFLTDINTIWSVGSTTEEWLAKTFVEDYREEIAQTAYLTGNPHSYRIFETAAKINHPASRYIIGNFDTVSVQAFDLVDNVWEYGWVDESAVPPRTMTNRCIQFHRNHNPERTIVHYMQPHRPYLDEDYQSLNQNTWERLNNNEIEVQEVKKAYRRNLEIVLDELSLLLSNVTAERVVITADHGEAFGELSKYGHEAAFPHPALKQVPIAVTQAVDEKTHDPDDPRKIKGKAEPNSAKKRLRDLGYL